MSIASEAGATTSEDIAAIARAHNQRDVLMTPFASTETIHNMPNPQRIAFQSFMAALQTQINFDYTGQRITQGAPLFLQEADIALASRVEHPGFNTLLTTLRNNARRRR
jgi:hypothetical protein